MHDTEDHSHLINMIDRMSRILPADRRRLKGVLVSEKDPDIHLLVIDDHIQYEEENTDPEGVLELLEYRREVMRMLDRPYQELVDIATKIQELALQQFGASKATPTAATSPVLGTPSARTTKRKRRRIVALS